MSQAVEQASINPFERLARRERDSILASCSRRLTIHQRVLLHRHYLDEESFTVIAFRFRRSVGSVSRMHTRALKSLKREMADRGFRGMKDF